MVGINISRVFPEGSKSHKLCGPCGQTALLVPWTINLQPMCSEMHFTLAASVLDFAQPGLVWEGTESTLLRSRCCLWASIGPFCFPHSLCGLCPADLQHCNFYSFSSQNKMRVWFTALEKDVSWIWSGDASRIFLLQVKIVFSCSC